MPDGRKVAQTVGRHVLAEDDSSQAVLAGEVQVRAERMLGTK